MDTIISIMDTLGWGLNIKWVDDLFNFQIPIAKGPNLGTWVYGHGLADIFRLAKRLGIQWHMVKTTDYAFVGIYLGFLWNLLSRTMSLPDKKRLKYLGWVKDALELVDTQKQRMTLDLASKLGGTLMHITFVHSHGIELVMRQLEELGTADANLLVCSDNEGVIKAVRHSHSQNFQVNLAIRRVEGICMAWNLVICLEYVCTTSNKVDLVSCRIPDRSLERFWLTFKLPEELKPFILHARK